MDPHRSRINVHLCVRERFCHLFSHSKRDVMSLAVVCSSSCITMEILVCRGAWTLITPSHSSVICRDTNRQHAEPGLCPACLWSLTNLVFALVDSGLHLLWSWPVSNLISLSSYLFSVSPCFGAHLMQFLVFPGPSLYLPWPWSLSHLISFILVILLPQKSTGPAQAKLFLNGHLVHLSHLRQ